MWGDNPAKGYGQVKFETSSHIQLAAQTTVRVNFNSQVRADKMGPNPHYKKDTPLRGQDLVATLEKPTNSPK